ncbi:MAG: hypothetical protein QGH83_08240 [Candidatus Pacebacteria bacterium]|nr:hypothetical protein [Candidatus Paceibacterota bacterium]
MSELEQTIEELEAEVLAELDEASDAQTKGAATAEPIKKVGKETPKGETEDLGGAKPEAKVEKGADEDRKEKAIGKKAADSADEVSGDAQQKGAGKADAPQKLAAGDDVEPEDDQEVVSEAKKLTKAQTLEQIGKMKKSEIDEMLAAHQSKLAEAENAKSEEELKKLEDAKADIEEKIKSISVKEDVAALTEGEELSEEFKEKAAIIFEAAVKSKTREEITRIHDSLTSEFDVKLSEQVEGLTEKVDTYLNYVVDEWMKENELAIERGLKGEIAEDFISGLKQLFEDHYIDVPNEKYDVLEAQSEKIDELESKVNQVMERNVALNTDKSGLVREQVISEASEDLTDTEIEKFKSLVEDVDFVDEESFRAKLDTLKDNYFPKTAVEQSLDDEDGGTAQDIDTTEAMGAYMSAISRNQQRAS